METRCEEIILRFLYINIYAFLLFILGISVYFIPINVLLIIIKFVIIAYCLAGAITILSRYKIKLRQINILEKRNSKNIRPDTFKMHIKTPCGQVLVSKVLGDLRKTEQYKYLSNSEWKNIIRSVYRRKIHSELKIKEVKHGQSI